MNRLREECTHEEARLVTREDKKGATEDQSLMVHTRGNYKKKENFHHNKKKDKKQKNTKIDPSNVRCYTCDEKGKFARDTMLILLKTMNQQTKDSEERRMIQMKSMC